ncbi:hypothetical protein [Ralstonia phage RP31]|uniref:Uncharacterized protein n=2 Tax=Ripduovirus RP12 TaxID=2560700 RepID=A0A1L7N144_9CAUD|nr:hypothetical protein FDH28_gp192 [Ralstonia phage RP12]BAW19203.1 hypothetical protein [Ralstonia phage RP12]BAW19489.1 hypothetical protein [Ralstonia phage RP31]
MTAATLDLNAGAETLVGVAEELAAKAGIKMEAKKDGDKSISGFGFFLRSAAVLMLFTAAIVAIAFGMHFGIAFVAGLGLGEMVTFALSALITVVGYLTSSVVGWYTGAALGELIVRRLATKAAKAAK